MPRIKALHQKAAAFASLKLFDSLNSFAKLESRIAALPDKQSRGDAFEVFAEAYLATQRRHEAEQVWPLNAVPTSVLQQLDLGIKDYGIDGIFRTQLGQYNAYQVKFRTNRPDLTWRELSTFIGLADSPHIRSRVLITNCDSLSSVLNDRQGFFCIRGSDLDRLEEDDFRAITAWIESAVYTAPQKTPKPHQQEALALLLPALAQHDRASAIMACGTGKTLVALWVVEQIQADRVLVLVPSLALLRQLLHEWLRETKIPNLAYLCVCSDTSVTEGVDSISTAQTDLDFPVSTDAAAVRGFLDAPFSGKKIVFSTYQSAQVVGAALQSGESFDLAVFDEAHKTAGREGRNYAFALTDANLSIRKRLFLTATPRHYNPHQRDREGEAQLIFSMDRPEVYGPQVIRLTFAEAARLGIICGYKVIISIITSEMVTNELLSRGEVMVQGDAVHARQVANQLALHDAIGQYGANKIFTFHKTVKSAESFVAEGSEGVSCHLPDFETFHVNGKMPTAKRERELRDFKAADRAVMSNARCLTEGVDVPVVDMVAFLSPRRSRVDIVQATGRAMRKAPGKNIGYVLVPLYVELNAGETVEAAVNRSDFDEVWDVLNSLQEQDDVLAELIRQFGEQKGSCKGFDDSRFSEHVDFGGPRLSLEMLRSAVATRCLDSLCSSWDIWFGKLKAFKERFGHCNVETGWEKDPGLPSWVSAQRTRRSKRLLSLERIQLLDGIGFVWAFQASLWDIWFGKLKVFKERFGHCNVETGWEEDSGLSSWVSSQRTRRNKGLLSLERIQLLDGIGFTWDFQTQKRQETWMKWYLELEKYTKKHGNPHVPSNDTNTKLASWVWIQRVRRDKDYLGQAQLTKEQVESLDTLGFRWKVHEEKWQEQFEELKLFKKKHGHCNVEQVAEEKDTSLSWVRTQRLMMAQGKLDEGRKEQLDAIGFLWVSNVIDAKWGEMFECLKNYHFEHGNADVPNKWKADGKLAAWVSHQRARRKNGLIVDEQIERLDELGFTWQHRERGTWEDRYQELLEFKENYGHCNVLLHYTDSPKLGPFVNTVRSLKTAGTLSDERIKLLELIGFQWAVNTDWEERYVQLLYFKDEYGHCNVPYNYSDNPQLANWVNQQRYRRKRGQLLVEREKILNEIDFNWTIADLREMGKNNPWNLRYNQWNLRYNQLIEFRQKHGHCDIPFNYPENSQLGWWVSNQRQRREKLSPERKLLLEEIGFMWSAK
ncbi:MAG: Helicase associated domain protein [Deltaproteobacteria bacterium]|nr:Helicase associated domain protein [Deltaproteobacteria bacterium]